jgi:sigma-E factor negative regulatory protein RseA
MTTDDNELLSALVDGELQGPELDRAIALLSTNADARERLQRYQLTSDVFHGYGIGHQQADFAQKITTALIDEPRHSPLPDKPVEKAKAISLPVRFWQHTLGLAIAASFGALAVVGVMEDPEAQFVPMVPMAVLNMTPVLAPVRSLAIAPHTMVAVAKTVPSTSSRGNRWTVEEQEIEDRLNVYLVDHNEYAGVSDIFSNARVVAYESGQ